MEPDPNNTNSTNIEAFLHGHQVNYEELEQDVDNDVPKKQRKRRRTSKAWGMFTKLPLDAYQDGKERSMCVCGQVYISETYVTLREYSENGDEYMKDMGKRKLEKFLKYWSDFCTILTIAVILDPRYKLQFVEWAYKKVYGENSKELKNIREKLLSLFDEYMLISNQSTNTSSMQGSVSHSNENDDRKGRGKLDSCLEEFDNFESMESSCTQKTQLELYLSEPRADRSSHLDILNFWKDNQVRYPELASMARDVLTIPISTVAFESTFSVCGRVLDQFRSSLKPETVESIVCSRDWIFGQEGYLFFSILLSLW
ncbi:BED-type domain-containing protein [Citrus sinensis]|nr:BED-type domain-containing protein [Citrus sinensis]